VNRPLAKLSEAEAVKVADTSDQGKAESKAISAVSTLLFLPPYSPELNPIEHFWSWLKTHLQKILPDYLSFDDALFDIFQVN